MSWIYNWVLLAGLFTTSGARAELFGVPAGLRLEGIGPLYGAVAGANNLVAERTNLLAGAAFGSVEAQGALVRDVPMGLPKGGLTFGFANLTQARFNTSYVRGLESGTVFEQEISGHLYGGGLEYHLLENLKLELGIVRSSVQLDDYYLNGQKIIRPNKNGFHTVKTDSHVMQIYFHQIPVGGGISLVSASGRSGQSDTLTATYSLNGQFAMLEKVTLHPRLRWSDAYISKQEKQYLDENRVRSALNTGCTTADCLTLENSLAGYIARNNLHGTAVPLGGSQGVRAFDEFSLKAAHTRLVALELRWEILHWLQLAPSYELGWGRDQTKDLYEKSVQSYGLGLRAKVKDFALRLATAQTHDQSAWFLTLERAQ